MTFDNPFYKRIKGSFPLIICCGYCKTDVALYQKVGRGNVLRMYIERIIKSAIDLSKRPGALVCPKCKKQLGTKVTLKRKGTQAYVMNRGAFNSRMV